MAKEVEETKEFPACFACGSKKRLVANQTLGLKPGDQTGMGVFNNVLSDPKGIITTHMKIMSSVVDACGDCGAVRVVFSKISMAPVQMPGGNGHGMGGGINV